MTKTNFSIGNLLMVGISGKTLNDQERLQLLQIKPAGIILFRRNVEKPEQVRELTDSLRALLGNDLIIGVDQEGGVVRRLTQGFTHITGAMALAAGNDINAAKRVAEICAQELHAVGINMNFAPVADVNNNPANPVIHVRAYSDEANTVAQYAQATANGLAENGVIPVAKHFPGHGDTAVDTHVGLAVVPHDLERLKAIELRPFRQLIANGIPAIMIAHVHFKSIDKQPLPASLSTGVVTELLKNKLGYSGLVLTDCLNMGAIKKWGALSEAITASLIAGVDMPLVSQNLSATVEALDTLDNISWDDVKFDRLNDALRKIIAVKETLVAIPQWNEAKRAIRATNNLQTMSKVQLKSITQLSGDTLKLKSGKDLNWVCIYNMQKQNDAEDQESYCYWLVEQCRHAGVKVVSQLNELTTEQKKTRGYALVISPRFDSLNIPVTEASIIHVATRLPVNSDSSNSDFKFAIYEESEAAQQALWEVLFCQHPALGKLPINRN